MLNFEEKVEGIKAVQKEIIVEIDRICQKHNLRYWLAYGTLIGAIRHDGFIPWDDDIDIMMPYKDLVKFVEICKTELDTQRFFYQSPETDVDYRLSIKRVRRNGTILLEESFAGKKSHKGIFVDIYPLFGAAPNGDLRKKQIKQAMKYCLYLLDEPVRNHGLIMKLGSSALLAMKTKKGKQKMVKKLFAEMSKYDFDSSEFVTVLDSGTKEMSTSYKREWFNECQKHKFDDLMLNVPNGYDSILKEYFGDYMQLPPEDQRKIHHNYVEIKLLGEK